MYSQALPRPGNEMSVFMLKSSALVHFSYILGDDTDGYEVHKKYHMSYVIMMESQWVYIYLPIKFIRVDKHGHWISKYSVESHVDPVCGAVV